MCSRRAHRAFNTNIHDSRLYLALPQTFPFQPENERLKYLQIKLAYFLVEFCEIFTLSNGKKHSNGKRFLKYVEKLLTVIALKFLRYLKRFFTQTYKVLKYSINIMEIYIASDINR